MSLRVAVYVRVSTTHQVETQTIEQQLERLRAYIQAQGWQLRDEHVFRDDGYSGASLNRPGLDRLRDTVRAGEVDRVLVTEPSRLTRNYVHQMVLLEELDRSGCQVEFLDRPMSQDPHDRLLLQIRGAVAEYERTLIGERMRRGRLMKYRAGVLLPWSRPPYGYRLSPDRPGDPAGVRVDETEAVVVREIFAWYEQEHSSLQGLAKHLQAQSIPTPSGKRIWSLCTLRMILRQPAYTGQVYACRSHYRPPHMRRSATHPIGRPHDTAVELPPDAWIPVATIPALVSREQFDRVQAKLAQNQSFARRNNKSHTYLLRALVSCGVCQSSCIARALQGGYTYYVCAGKANPIRSRKEAKCPSRYSPAQQLDELVWQDLCDVLTHPEIIAQALERAQGGHWLPQELQARRENLRRARVHLEQQLNRLTEAYLDEVIPLEEYKRRRRELEQKLEVLDNQDKQLVSQVDRQAEVAGLVRSVENFCQRVRAGLASATFEQKRQLVELLIDRVIVADGEVEIRYVIPTSSSSEHVRFCHLRSDYFGDPHLVRAHHRQPLHQVGIAWKGMPAVGRARLASSCLALQAQASHQPPHTLAVDAPALPVQLRGEAAIAVRRPPGRHLHERLFQFRLSAGLAAIVVTAAGIAQDTADHLNGILLGQLGAHAPFSLCRRAKKLDAFFATSSSSARRPTRRSNSAMRAASSLRCSLLRNTWAAFSTNSAFQRASTSGLRPYSRQVSAVLFTPVSTSNAAFALNSGVKLRRFVRGMVALLPGHLNLISSSVQV